MKLLIVLSVIACGYAAKLDRTYLPPSSAATAGGSLGALNAPAGPGSSGSPGFGHPSGVSGFGQPSELGPSNGAGFVKSASAPAFGSQSSGANGFGPSAQYGQPGAPTGGLDTGFSQPAQNFGAGAQDYQSNQPQRAQASADQSAQILRLDNMNDGETFSYSFETSNGIAVEESGVATNGVQAQGAYSYSDDEGQNFRVTYTADENGYLPQGDHLPTPHPIPEEILKSIEQNAQAAAAGTQEGAYNPNEDNDDSTPQKYRNNAPTSYGQGPTGAGSYNQPQGGRPSQLYGAPTAAGASSRPQSGNLDFQPLSPQQYSAPSNGASPFTPSNGFGQSKPQSPSQLYGSPSNGAPSTNGAAQARPNNFGQNQFQSQGPSQQYGAPSRPGAPSGPISNGFGPSGPVSNGFAPSSTQSIASQYSASSQSRFPSAGQRPVPGQAQDDSGYQYDKPQGSSFGQGPNGRPSNQSPAGQYRPQNGVSPSGAQGSFPRPSANNFGYPSGPAQGSFGPSSGPSSQGSFGPAAAPKASFSSGPRGSSSFGPSPGPAGQSFGPSSGPKGPSSFAPSSGSPGQSSFGPSAGSNGFARPQGSFPSAGTKGAMPESGYNYSRPGSPGTQPGVGSQQPQGGSNGSSGPGQFGGPRQPPSFSEEEGYKY